VSTTETISRAAAALDYARRHQAELEAEQRQYSSNLARLCQEGSGEQIGDMLARRAALPFYLWGAAVVMARCEIAALSAEHDALIADLLAASSDKDKARLAHSEVFISLGGLSKGVPPTHPDLLKLKEPIAAAAIRWSAAHNRANGIDGELGQARRRLKALIDAGPPGSGPTQPEHGYIGMVAAPTGAAS
jgi:hypothetical protein